MANTYTQILIHIVFRVGNPHFKVEEASKSRVERYITGIVQKKGQKLIAIYCNPDHIHLLIGHNPEIAISDIIRDIKVWSTKFINVNKLSGKDFRWQRGYGAFSCAQRDLRKVVGYITNQDVHHQRVNFREEYKLLLQEYEIEFSDNYLFDY